MGYNKTRKYFTEADMATKKMAPTNCEQCRHYVYNYEEDYYECMINLDEDEYARFLQGTNYSCPYFDLDDEYKIVRKQA